MIAPRGLVVSVGFDDLLSITLARNSRFLSECLVVTTPDDERTKTVARSVPGVTVFETDAFTRHGAAFNKGLAVEEALNYYARFGWLLIWDADTLFPEHVNITGCRPGYLYGSRRVILDDASKWHPDFQWAHAGPISDDPAIGFFQLFHADSPVIKNKRPWYDVSFAHAGGCDAYFLELWPAKLVRRVAFNCLHLGPVATNWYQRAFPRLDGEPVEQQSERLAQMNSLIRKADWTWARPGLKFDEMVEIPDTPHRVSVPGYAESKYEMPVIRQKGMRERKGFHS